MLNKVSFASEKPRRARLPADLAGQLNGFLMLDRQAVDSSDTVGSRAMAPGQQHTLPLRLAFSDGIETDDGRVLLIKSGHAGRDGKDINRCCLL